jgi:hypothetical protein
MGVIEKYQGYEEFLSDLKLRIQRAQVKAINSVNAELLNLFWQIGRGILDRQSSEGWGSAVIERLAKDLKSAMPNHTEFSVRNLKYMRTFVDLWSNGVIVQAPLAQLSWYQHIVLIDKHTRHTC